MPNSVCVLFLVPCVRFKNKQINVGRNCLRPNYVARVFLTDSDSSMSYCDYITFVPFRSLRYPCSLLHILASYIAMFVIAIKVLTLLVTRDK